MKKKLDNILTFCIRFLPFIIPILYCLIMVSKCTGDMIERGVWNLTMCLIAWVTLWESFLIINKLLLINLHMVIMVGISNIIKPYLYKNIIRKSDYIGLIDDALWKGKR